MSPWQILGDVVGWVLLGLLAFVVVVFVAAVVVAVVRSFRPRRGRAHQIYSSGRDRLND